MPSWRTLRNSLCDEDRRFPGISSATNPVPGGGSVAALAGALAAALGKMAIGFTLHKKGFQSRQARLQEFRGLLEDSLAELRQAVDRDAQAYAQVVAAQQLPESTEPEKHDPGAATTGSSPQRHRSSLRSQSWHLV